MKIDYKILSIVLMLMVAAMTLTFLQLTSSEYHRELRNTMARQTNSFPSPTLIEITPTPIQQASPTVRDIKLVPWKLTQGDPKDTCTSPTYEGVAKLKGWYVWDYNYVNKEWMFRVAAGELKNLPVDKLSSGDNSLLKYYQENPIFGLVNPSEALEEELKQAGSDNPVEIVVTRFNQYCEGRASLTIQE